MRESSGMRRLFWFDVETTGLSAIENGIIQIAGIVEVDGSEVDSFDLRMNPGKKIDDAALAVNGVSRETIASYPPAESAFRELLGILRRHVVPDEEASRLVPAGYNVRFDLDFLERWFIEANGPDLYGFITRRSLDPSRFLQDLQRYLGKDRIPSRKLERVAALFGLDGHEAHDAASDIRATREIHRRIEALLSGGQ